jgi:RND family efflux transporter MFP subunit
MYLPMACDPRESPFPCRRKGPGIGLGLLVAVFAGFPACGQERAPSLAAEPTPEAAPVEVRVAAVVGARTPRTVRGMGSFSAHDAVLVASKVAGRIVAVGPEVGDRAPKGGLLARVDPTDYALLREQKSRMLSESLARLGLDRVPEGDADFETLPAIERARLEAANARVRYERALKVRERTPGAYSDQDISDLKAPWDIAESVLRAARLIAQAELAQARARKADLEVVEQLVRDTETLVPEGAEVRLVAERRVAVGDYVAVGAPLYRLIDPDPLRLRVRVPERRMAGVEPGRLVSVTTASRPGAIEGRVLRVRPEVDLRTRTYDVEVEVPNPDFDLHVGAFAVAEIRVGEDVDVPAVPASAVRTFAGVSRVLVPDGEKAGERRVRLGRRLGESIEILEGLAVGDLYLVDPPPGLSTGAAIRVVAPEPGAPPAPAPPRTDGE